MQYQIPKTGNSYFNLCNEKKFIRTKEEKCFRDTLVQYCSKWSGNIQDGFENLEATHWEQIETLQEQQEEGTTSQTTHPHILSASPTPSVEESAVPMAAWLTTSDHKNRAEASHPLSQESSQMKTLVLVEKAKAILQSMKHTHWCKITYSITNSAVWGKITVVWSWQSNVGKPDLNFKYIFKKEQLKHFHSLLHSSTI